jgi:hypothetical protein
MIQTYRRSGDLHYSVMARRDAVRRDSKENIFKLELELIEVVLIFFYEVLEVKARLLTKLED